MTTSLKAFIPKLAKALEMNPTALYERQRALVRGGLLEAKAGHGPGSGVRLSPESVAMLLISVLATQSLVDVESTTRDAADFRGEDGQPFVAVLARTLGSEVLAAQCSAVIYMNVPGAIIHWGEHRPAQAFMRRAEKKELPIMSTSVMRGEIILQIAKEIANAG